MSIQYKSQKWLKGKVAQCLGVERFQGDKEGVKEEGGITVMVRKNDMVESRGNILESFSAQLRNKKRETLHYKLKIVNGRSRSRSLQGVRVNWL